MTNLKTFVLCWWVSCITLCRKFFFFCWFESDLSRSAVRFNFASTHCRTLSVPPDVFVISRFPSSIIAVLCLALSWLRYASKQRNGPFSSFWAFSQLEVQLLWSHVEKAKRIRAPKYFHANPFTLILNHYQPFMETPTNIPPTDPDVEPEILNA